MEPGSILVALFLGCFVISLICIITLLFSLAKQGDERKQYIKSKAIQQTFVITVGILVIDIISSLVTDDHTINPFIFLTVISVVFLIALLLNKKRYGD
ncbi:hypothetical protein ABNN70_12595 [Sporolactobacillus sp. Y61]|uniref:DUF2178 domain-containing protein n=1 Tax=Sporolactobacillus sp. Y61 TaxID=3160863 RepID=A0AAU8IE55_9BACL